MRLNTTRVLVTGATAVLIGVYAEIGFSSDKDNAKDPEEVATAKGLKWLVSVQGKDGGWGQDGGETSYVRQGEHLESSGNDVANTAVVAEALLHTGTTAMRGEYREQLQRAVDFILKHVEQSPTEGLAITNQQGTQIERKLGPFIDTFLTAKLLAELDSTMPDAKANARVRQDLQKCVAKIEKAQLKDGSWNLAGGWAPILGTSMASQSLYIAQAKGAVNSRVAMNRIDSYTKLSAAAPPRAPAAVAPAPVSATETVTVTAATSDVLDSPLGRIGSPSSAGGRGGVGVGVGSSGSYSASAGVPLYKKAQELEQLTRTGEDREKNAKQIQDITGQLSDSRFVTGFGSIGGEEFFSYLNISESLRRTGGPEWKRWNGEMTAKLLKLQNEDGTWAGHHCITGRVAVTSAAILLLTADRQPAPKTQANAAKH